MTPDPYTQLAHHLHALGMGYPLRDNLVDILSSLLAIATFPYCNNDRIWPEEGITRGKNTKYTELSGSM